MNVCETCGKYHKYAVDDLVDKFLDGINKEEEPKKFPHDPVVTLKHYYKVMNDDAIPMCVRESFKNDFWVKLLTEKILP